MKREIGAVEASQRFDQLLDDVCEGHGEYIVTRADKPVAAVISVERYEQFMKERDERFEVFDRIWARMPPISEEDAEREVQAAIDEVRAAKRRK